MANEGAFTDVIKWEPGERMETAREQYSREWSTQRTFYKVADGATDLVNMFPLRYTEEFMGQFGSEDYATINETHTGPGRDPEGHVADCVSGHYDLSSYGGLGYAHGGYFTDYGVYTMWIIYAPVAGDYITGISQNVSNHIITLPSAGIWADPTRAGPDAPWDAGYISYTKSETGTTISEKTSFMQGFILGRELRRRKWTGFERPDETTTPVAVQNYYWDVQEGGSDGTSIFQDPEMVEATRSYDSGTNTTRIQYEMGTGVYTNPFFLTTRSNYIYTTNRDELRVTGRSTGLYGSSPIKAYLVYTESGEQKREEYDVTTTEESDGVWSFRITAERGTIPAGHQCRVVIYVNQNVRSVDSENKHWVDLTIWHDTVA